jgi:hypothetical protein
MKLTEKDRQERDALVKDYNRARRKDSKQSRYNKLMEFEQRMLNEGKNG